MVAATQEALELLTLDEAAREFLKVSPATLQRLVKSGEIRAVKIGARSVRFDRRELIRYVEKKQAAPAVVGHSDA